MNTERKLCVGVKSNLDDMHYTATHPSSKFIHEFFIGPPTNFGRSDRPRVGITDFKDLPEYVKLAHENGIKLNIASNATDYGGKEYDPEFIKEFLGFYDHLGNLGVDSITLGNSKIIEHVGRHKLKHGGPKIAGSIYVEVNSPLLAEEYAELGVDRVIIPRELNRDFQLQKRIMDYQPQLEYELYATTKCLSSGACPHKEAHASYKSSQGEKALALRAKQKDPVVVFCKNRRIHNTLDSIFTAFIRPEDVPLYEENSNNQLGLIKLATREASNEMRILQVEAYGNRHHEGNLADLWTMSPKDVRGIPNKGLDGALEKVKHLYPEEQKPFYEHLSQAFDSVATESKETKIQVMQDTIKNYKI